MARFLVLSSPGGAKDGSVLVAKVPHERTFATKTEPARALASPLPIAWVTADSLYGQDRSFRHRVEQAGLGYAVAVPKPQQVKPPAGTWRIDRLIADAPDDAWQRISCGDGAQGPRLYDWAAAQFPAPQFFGGDQPTHRRWVPARRSLAKSDEIASCLAYAPTGTTVEKLVRIAGTRWAVEECFQAAKNACGLDQYEVRRYPGWYRHLTLAMLAHAVLAAMAARESERGAAETDPPSGPSPWRRSDGCGRLALPGQRIVAAILSSTRRGGPAGAAGTRPSPADVTTGAAPGVTNCRDLIPRQPATLGNTPLTSGDGELPLEY